MAMNFHDYPYTDLHEMNLDWCIAKVKELTAAWAVTRQDWTDTQQAWEEMKTYINNYFDNLNVQTEINNKLDALVADGTLSDLISPFVASGLPSVVADQLGDVVAAQIGGAVAAQISAVVADQLPAVVATETAGQAAAWLAEHVDPETGYVIDDSLTIAGAAADAKAAGDAIGEVKSALTNSIKLDTDMSVDSSGYEEAEISFPNAGQLYTNGTITPKDGVYTSDFIEIKDYEHIIRCGKSSTKYAFLPYCFYTEANEASFISPRVKLETNYEYSTLYGRQYATQIDYSSYPTAKYIRLSNNVSDSVGTKYYKETQINKYDVSTEFTSDTTRRLDDKIDGVQEEIDNIVKQHSVILCRQYDSDISAETYINPSNGSESSYSSYDASPFLPVKKGDILFLNYVQSMIFYNASKAYIDGFATSTIDGYISDAENIYTIDVDDVAYMRVNFRQYKGYAVTKIDNDPYDVLNLGDSIFGLNVKPNDISTYAELKTQKKFANCGFGGTTAKVHNQAMYDAFSFHSLADAIYSEDFSTQESYLPSINMAPYTMNLRILKSIDFTKLKVITIAYGTNDWYGANRPIDNPNNKYDIDTYCGALRYGIEKLISKYPKILLCLCSPIFRYLLTEQESSDTLENTAGDTLVDYVEAMEGIAREYHLPFFNHYYIGINTLNRNTYLQQGSTHLTYFEGAKLVGDKLGGEIDGVI